MKTSLSVTVIAAALSLTALSVQAGPLLNNGQTVTASFDSGKLKGKTFRLRYNENANMLKDRPVTSHTAQTLAIKTPGGWCRFHASGVAECHNGVGTWTAN